jgi:hypothetical protein
MATVYHAVCIEDFTPAPDEDPTFVLQRGREYTISPEREDGQVRVFSRYWALVPARLFAGHRTLQGEPVQIESSRVTPPSAERE